MCIRDSLYICLCLLPGDYKVDAGEFKQVIAGLGGLPDLVELEMSGRGATIVASDESFLCVVEAQSEDLVRLAYARAGVPFERISAALTEQH